METDAADGERYCGRLRSDADVAAVVFGIVSRSDPLTSVGPGELGAFPPPEQLASTIASVAIGAGRNERIIAGSV